MKRASNELFDLIKTLQASESRYFVLYAQRHFTKDTSYLLVFKFIQEMKEYDEAQLINHFKKNSWIKHFAVIKKQLYYTLLDALHQYDEYNNLEQEIKKGIHYATLLLKKGLFQQCKKLLIKYKAQAYELEKHEYVLELIDIEKRLINKAFIYKEDGDAISKIDLEEKQCIEQIYLSGKYWKQSSLIYQQHYQKKISIGHPTKELTQLAENIDFKDLSLAKTTKAKLDFFQINALNSFIHRDTEKAFEYNKQFLQLLDENKKMRILHADRYFSVLNNYLIDSLILRKYEILFNGIQQLREIAKLNEFKHISNIEANVFRLSYSLELNYYVSQQQFEKGKNIIPTIEQGLSKFKNKIIKPSIITMQYLSAYILFFNQDYTACLDKIDEIILDKDAINIKDIYRDARFIQLLCHFELGNHQLVESLIISFQRYLIKEKISFKTYSTIMKYFNAYYKNPYKKNRMSLSAAIELLTTDNKERAVFNNFNYSLWIEKSNFKN